MKHMGSDLPVMTAPWRIFSNSDFRTVNATHRDSTFMTKVLPGSYRVPPREAKKWRRL